MILTTDQIPEYGIVRAYLTATAVQWGDSGDSDDYTDEHGWVDADWSMRELHESRNDVKPYAEWNPRAGEGTVGRCAVDSDEITSVADFVNYTLTDFFGTTGWEDNGDGTFYGADAITTDYTDPRNYTYALHFHVKHNDSSRGWTEDEVTLP